MISDRGQPVTWSVVIAANVRSSSMLQYTRRLIPALNRPSVTVAAPIAPATLPAAPIVPATLPAAPIAPATLSAAPIAPATLPAAPIVPVSLPAAPILPSTGAAVPVTVGTDPNSVSGAAALNQLSYWINLVVQNNYLPNQQSVPQASLTHVPHLHPAPARPLFPSHATSPRVRPYNINNPNVGHPPSNVQLQIGPNIDNRTSRDMIGQARSLQDITNAESLFYVGTSGKLLCRCCVESSGFEIPSTVLRVSPNNANRTILTDSWRDFKKKLRKHLLLPTHVNNSRHFHQRQGLQQNYARADTEAGITLIRMVYENIKTHRSYTSFSHSCVMRYLEGSPIGFQNHSPQFPAAIVDCSYDVLKDAMGRYLSTPTPFGTTLPFGISADKDRSKNRSRQLTGLRFPSFDDELTLPFILTTYLGHPSCAQYTGGYLSQKVSDLVQSVGINVSQFTEGFTGSSYDGQYLNLKVNDHLKMIYGLHADNKTTEIWDGAHIVDLIHKKSAKQSPAISTVISVVHGVTIILKNSVYEKYLSCCRSMNLPMKQPKTPKDLKFIKHGLDQMEDFMKMRPAILRTLETVSQGQGVKQKLAAKCRAYLIQVIQPSFDLILSFVVDLIKLLAAFSLQFQRKHIFVHEYYNLSQMLQQLLQNVNLSYDVSAMSVDQTFVFQNFCKAVQARSPSPYFINHVQTRSGQQRTFDDCIRVAVGRCKRFVRLLISKSFWFWFAHPYWKEETTELLPHCAAFLNDLFVGIFEQRKNFITGGKEMCIDCERFLNEEEQDGHDQQCQSNVFISVPSLLPNFTPQGNPDLSSLRKILPLRLQHHVTTQAIMQLRQQLLVAKASLVRIKVEPTVDSVSKYLFTNQDCWDKCLQGILLLFLKLLVMPCTEAFMETLGSIMERYHERFRNQDPGLDDRRLQKEMFVCQNGPPIIFCGPFIKKVLAKYRSTGRRRFAHETSTLARLPVTSLTIQRLKREAKADPNSIPCLDFS